MKKIKCPKCHEIIQFEETQYEPGRILVFQCPTCNKRFKLRIPERDAAEEKPSLPVYGYITVLENDFQERQVFPLHEGRNVIGRYVRGTKINTPIITVDPSIDTTHCLIQVSTTSTPPKFILSDAPSGTGTFLGNDILSNRDKRILSEGDVISIGAATLIVSLNSEEQ